MADRGDLRWEDDSQQPEEVKQCIDCKTLLPLSSFRKKANQRTACIITVSPASEGMSRGIEISVLNCWSVIVPGRKTIQREHVSIKKHLLRTIPKQIAFIRQTKRLGSWV